MKIVSFNGNRIGVLNKAGRVVDVTELGGGGAEWPPTAMIRFVDKFQSLRREIESLCEAQKGVPLAEVRLEAPITWPNKLIAIPVNYHAHAVEMSSPAISTAAGFFLKANSSLSGPNDPIVLPDLPGREIHHEAELAVIIGKKGRNITKAQAREYIFGLSCLLDITIRGKQERVMRKSYDTFTPLGPWMVTTDEAGDYSNLDIKLTVNGEVRQTTNTSKMIIGVDEIVEMCSSAMTLYPGDVIATGTCEGVGPIRAGDVVYIVISGVGEMSINVKQGEGGSNVAIPARV